ncbi:MAG: hypothetical protein GY847_22850 [Proteobacteria bacterium]|nr:hypothetical protein [Pseudomonadota bacterium]
MQNNQNHYSDSVLLRSLVQAIPYLGPLIDNAMAIPQSKRERNNQWKFLEGLAEEVEELKDFLPMANKQPKYSILPKILDRIGKEDDESKGLYYRHLYLSIDLYRTKNGDSPLDIWPKHYLKIIDQYSKAHFDTMKYLHDTFKEVEWVSIKRGEFSGFYEALNIPGGTFMKILLDLEQDFLINVFFRNNLRIFSLTWVESIEQTIMWDEFFITVIEPPLH